MTERKWGEIPADWLKDGFRKAYGTEDLGEAKRRAEVHEEWARENGTRLYGRLGDLI